MPELVIATTATEVPMGAQAYQEAITSRAQSALDDLQPGWQVRRSIARSMRSHLPGTLRLPMGRVSRSGPALRRAVGALVYPRGAVVHRMDLALPPPPGPEVVTLHDLVAWHFPDESAPIGAAKEELRRADKVICVSQFTAEQAVGFLGISDPVVVHNGVDHRFFCPQPLTPEQRAIHGVPPDYVLYAGGSAQRKNLPALAAAWALLADAHPDVHLALAGPTNPAREQLFAGSLRVHHLGRLPDEVMPGLIAGARVFVVPSLVEGFGLPALEGMAARVPVVAARTSSLPEVVGDAGLLVSPDGSGIAEGVEAALADTTEVRAMAERGAERAREFTWDRSAAGHARVWADVAP